MGEGLGGVGLVGDGVVGGLVGVLGEGVGLTGGLEGGFGGGLGLAGGCLPPPIEGGIEEGGEGEEDGGGDGKSGKEMDELLLASELYKKRGVKGGDGSGSGGSRGVDGGSSEGGVGGSGLSVVSGGRMSPSQLSYGLNGSSGGKYSQGFESKQGYESNKLDVSGGSNGGSGSGGGSGNGGDDGNAVQLFVSVESSQKSLRGSGPRQAIMPSSTDSFDHTTIPCSDNGSSSGSCSGSGILDDEENIQSMSLATYNVYSSSLSRK